MKGRTGWFFIISLALLCSVLLSSGWAHAYVYGQVGPGPSYPSDGTVTFMAYLSKGGDTDNEVLTEDNWNCGLGTDKGYTSEYFFIDHDNFVSPSAQDEDTLVILFTGIGAQTGNAGSLTSTIDDSVSQQDLGNSTWGASTNPNTPINLQAVIVTQGVVDLSWTGTKNGYYRVYRSSQASGFIPPNGASNGRYRRIAKDLSTASYRDSSAPLAICWYIVVADDIGNLSGHTDEVAIDAALPVQLATFTATGGQQKVILEWTTESEWDNRGFHIWRREDGSRDFKPLNQELIPGAGNSSSPRDYSWMDRQVQNGRTYWYQLESLDFQGSTKTYGPVSATPMDALPQAFQLLQNYPNPFNPQTWIGYQLPKSGPVTIKIYNVRGQLVDTLVDAEQAPGYYRVCWSGRNQHGNLAASGVYFCRMSSGSFTKTVKMILLK